MINFYHIIEGHEGVEYALIRDGMNAEYNVFGKVISTCNDEYSGWGFVNLDFKELNSEEVKNKYKEVFEVEGAVAEPYLFIFSNFS